MLDDDLSQPSAIAGDSFRISALQKEVCITLSLWISSGIFPTWTEVRGLCPELRLLWHHRNNLTVDDNGIIWRKRSTQSPLLQLLVPKPGRKQFFLSYHASLFGGHLGRNRTLVRLAHRFYWSGMADDVKEWLRQCVMCVKRKSPGGRHHLLGNIPTGHRWDRIAMDILDVCNLTPDGYRYILMIADYFSKWTEAFPIKNNCADTVADILMKKIILRFGMPLVIHSDQGREFENGLMKSLCALLGCTKTRTAPYHPESDGMIECFNWTCFMMLSMFVNDPRDNWHDLLPYVMHAYRTSVHESTGYSPFRLMMRESALCHIMFPLLNLVLTWNMTYRHIRSRLGLMIMFENHCIGQRPARSGYMTLRQWIGNSLLNRGCYHSYPPAARHKLGSPWIGPNQVVRQTVGIQRSPDKPIVFVHVDDLKLCPAPEDVKWNPGISTAKSQCTSTVAFRPGSHVSDITSTPSVNVSSWEDADGHHSRPMAVSELDRPIDLTGHVLSPFYIRNIDYQDSRFNSIAHLMCYRYAVAAGQKTFATGITKWSKHLTDFPTPKCETIDWIQQWQMILMDIYSHLCQSLSEQL